MLFKWRWEGFSRATGGRHALVRWTDSNAIYGRRLELTYYILKQSR